MASLITALGGPEISIARLSFFHNSGLLYVGDEQAFLPVFQFHYAGRPGLSTRQAHAYIPPQFNTRLAVSQGTTTAAQWGRSPC
jgi:Glycosyl hydrolase family 92